MDVFGTRSSRRAVRRSVNLDDCDIPTDFELHQCDFGAKDLSAPIFGPSKRSEPGEEALRRILRLEGRFGTLSERIQWLELEGRLKKLEKIFVLVDWQKLETTIDASVSFNSDVIDYAVVPSGILEFDLALNDCASETTPEFPDVPSFPVYQENSNKEIHEKVDEIDSANDVQGLPLAHHENVQEILERDLANDLQECVDEGDLANDFQCFPVSYRDNIQEFEEVDDEGDLGKVLQEPVDDGDFPDNLQDYKGYLATNLQESIDGSARSDIMQAPMEISMKDVESMMQRLMIQSEERFAKSIRESIRDLG